MSDGKKTIVVSAVSLRKGETIGLSVNFNCRILSMAGVGYCGVFL